MALDTTKDREYIVGEAAKILAQIEIQDQDRERARLENEKAKSEREIEFSLGERGTAIYDVMSKRFLSIVAGPSLSEEIFFAGDRPPLTEGPAKNPEEFIRNFNSTLGLMVEGMERGVRAALATPLAIIAGAAEFGSQLGGMEPGEGKRLERDLTMLAESMGVATISMPGTVAGRVASPKRKPKQNPSEIRKEADELKAVVIETAAGRAIAYPAGAPGVTSEIAKMRYKKVFDDLEDATIEITGNATGPADIKGAPIKLPTLSLEAASVQKNVLEAAAEFLSSKGVSAAGLAPSRASEVLTDAVVSGEMTQTQLLQLLTKKGVKPTQFGEFLGRARREAVGDINKLAKFEAALRGDETLGGKMMAKAYERTSGIITSSSRAGHHKSLVDEYALTARWWERAQNRWRGLLITQMATAVRNFTTQIGRVGLDVMGRGMDKVIQKTFRPDLNDTSEPIAAFGEMSRIFMPGKNGVGYTKEQVDKLIKIFPEIEDDLFARLSADYIAREKGSVTAFGRAVDSAVLMANAANNFQEKLVRRAVFAAKLDRSLEARGTNLREVMERGGEIRTSDVAEAIEHALEMTFSKSPGRGTVAADWLSLMNKVPGMAIFVPFPRFMYNAIKTTNDFMPTGYLKLLSGTERAAIAEGNYKTISKATIGSAMLGFAWAARQGNIPGLTPGEKWYEFLDQDNNVIDVRPFAPLTTPLFVADTVQRMMDGRIVNMTAKDVMEGILGNAPQFSTGLEIIDQAVKTIAGSSPEKLKELAGTLAGGVVAGVLTPLRQINDFGQEFGLTDQVVRTTRGDPTGAIQKSLPNGPEGFFGLLEPQPNFESPTRGDDVKHPRVSLPFSMGTLASGVVKQLTGLNIREPKNVIEKELDRLGFNPRDLRPRTGDANSDIIVQRFMGPYLEVLGTALVSTEGYRGLNVRTQQYLVNEAVKESRSEALKFAKDVSPTMKGLSFLERLPEIEERLIDSVLEDSGLKLRDIREEMRKQLRGELRTLQQR